MVLSETSIPTHPRLADHELANMIDNILHDDDRNMDGYIDYTEFVTAQRGRQQQQQHIQQQQMQQQQMQQQQMQQQQMHQQQMQQQHMQQQQMQQQQLQQQTNTATVNQQQKF